MPRSSPQEPTAGWLAHRRSGGAQPCRQSACLGPPGPAELMQDLNRSRGSGDDPTGTRCHRPHPAIGTHTVSRITASTKELAPVSGRVLLRD
jgi:hypothetical protein